MLSVLAGHSSVRSFQDRAVDDKLIELVCACALSAPSKSDLQLRDIIVLKDPERRGRIIELIPGTDWLRDAPVFMVLCGNAERLEALSERAGLPFPNRHADQLVNSVADAAITLGWLQAAANSAGLGGCAVSGLRERPQEIADLLALPPRVLPFAGFAMGWPKEKGSITPRLPLDVTVHVDRMSTGDNPHSLATYENNRGAAGAGGWADRRAVQYSKPKNAQFDPFLRRAGFVLDPGQ
jgi:nitroreductase/FMN reductase [NAD(P)H]